MTVSDKNCRQFNYLLKPLSERTFCPQVRQKGFFEDVCEQQSSVHFLFLLLEHRVCLCYKIHVYLVNTQIKAQTFIYIYCKLFVTTDHFSKPLCKRIDHINSPTEKSFVMLSRTLKITSFKMSFFVKIRKNRLQIRFSNGLQSVLWKSFQS